MGPDGERGMLGAMGGAALGGFGGHKLGAASGYGGLGTFGGLIAGGLAGSKLEDFGKEYVFVFSLLLFFPLLLFRASSRLSIHRPLISP